MLWIVVCPLTFAQEFLNSFSFIWIFTVVIGVGHFIICFLFARGAVVCVKATLNTDGEERANREMPNLKMDKNLDEILGYLP